VEEKEAKFCFSCDTGYKSTEGQPTCAICVAGYYWGVMVDETKAVTEDGFGCEQCPTNAVCVEGVVEGDLFQPVPKDGYWIDTQAAGANPILVREVCRDSIMAVFINCYYKCAFSVTGVQMPAGHVLRAHR
jgi:hypothetical protein